MMTDREDTDSLISPVTPANWTDRQKDVMGDLIRPDGSAPNIIATLVRHPDLCQGWIALSGTLLHQGLLSSRDRELIILRIAWRTRSVYEWRQHAGRVDELTLSSLSKPSTVEFETSVERDLITSVDEFCALETIGLDNWTRLAQHYDDQQLLEIVFLCTQYRALASVLGILRVKPDTNTPPLPPLVNDGDGGGLRG